LSLKGQFIVNIYLEKTTTQPQPLQDRNVMGLKGHFIVNIYLEKTTTQPQPPSG
jgi:hypothetical protein